MLPRLLPAPPSTSSDLESSLSALFLPLKLSMSTSELSAGDLEPSGRVGDWEALELSSGVSDILQEIHMLSSVYVRRRETFVIP